MSIELNKPEQPDQNGTSGSNESQESLAFLLILIGILLDFANLLFRFWFNPFFILMILAGWILLGNSQQRVFRGGMSLLLFFLFIFGGFFGRPLFHLGGIVIGLSVLIGSPQLEALLKKSPGASSVLSILQGMRGLLRKLTLVALGIVTFLLIAFFASRDFVKRAETVSELNAIKAASEKYFANTGRYPSSLAELIGNDPLKREWLNDGWGAPYVFTTGTGAPTVISTGSGSEIKL